MAKRSLLEPIIRHAKDVTPEPMRWLWEPYIPRDMLVMVDGDPGIGKSTLIAQLATQLSMHWPFLDQVGKPTLQADIDGPQHTVILSAEDSLEHVLVPRLQKAGADIGYIHFLDGMKDPKDHFIPFNLQHLSVLVDTITAIKPVLVVLDPLVAYLGRIDMHRSNDTRPLMADLGRVANDYHCTIIGVRHPSKLDQGGPLMYRGQGNMDIVGAARSALWVQKHPTHPETQSLMIHSKSNIGIHGRSVLFSREYGDFRWQGVTRLTEPMFTGKGPDPYAFLEAFFWLEETLTPGVPYESTKIDTDAEKEGINHKTLNRAKKALGIRASKQGETWFLMLPHLTHTHTTTCPTSPTPSTSPTSPTSPSSMETDTYTTPDTDTRVDQVSQVTQEGQVDQVVSEEANRCPQPNCRQPMDPNQIYCLACGQARR